MIFLNMQHNNLFHVLCSMYLVVLWIHVQCCVLLVWSHCLLCSLPCHEVSWMLYGGAQHCVLPVCEPVLSPLTGKVDKAMRGTQLTPTKDAAQYLPLSHSIPTLYINFSNTLHGINVNQHQLHWPQIGRHCCPADLALRQKDWVTRSGVDWECC